MFEWKSFLLVFPFLKTNPQISEGFRFFLPVQLSKIKKYIFSLIFQ